MVQFIIKGCDILENYLTPQEVADKLKIDVRTIYRWIREKKLKAVKLVGGWRISENELNRLLQRDI
jgi:acetyl-CoA synthetase